MRAERRSVAGQVHHLGSLAGHDVVLVRCGRSLVASAAATQAVLVDNADYREWIWRSFGASAVDQETAPIAQVAYTNGVPFIAFRGLSDLAGGREGPSRARDLGGLAAGNAARAALVFLEAWEE